MTLNRHDHHLGENQRHLRPKTGHAGHRSHIPNVLRRLRSLADDDAVDRQPSLPRDRSGGLCLAGSDHRLRDGPQEPVSFRRRSAGHGERPGQFGGPGHRWRRRGEGVVEMGLSAKVSMMSRRFARAVGLTVSQACPPAWSPSSSSTSPYPPTSHTRASPPTSPRPSGRRCPRRP